MPRFLPTVLAIVLGGTATAAEPALRLTIPDAAGTAQRLSEGPFSAVWRAGAPALASPIWQPVVEQTRQVRLQCQLGPRQGGLPAFLVEVGLLAPAAATPASMPHLRILRSEAWILASSGPGVLELPPVVQAVDLPRADAVVDVDLPAWIHLLPPAAGALAGRLVTTCAIGAVRLEMVAGPAGIVDRGILPGAKLPLRPLDPAALAGCPDHPLVLLAAGLDGAALGSLLATVLGENQVAVDAVAALTGTDLASSGGVLDGTVVFALVPGKPLPGWLLVLPRRPVLDLIVKDRIDEQAPDTADEVFAMASEQPVVVGWPGLGRAAVQCTAQRWVIASSAALVHGLVGEDPSAYDVAQTWPEAGESPLALVQADLARLAPLVAAALPSGQRPLAEALVAGAGGLPPLAVVVTAEEGRYVFQGRNGLGLLLPATALLPALLPAVQASYHDACQIEARKRIVELVARGRQFAAVTSGHWPRDLEDLRAWAKTLPADIAVQAGRPDLPAPFCYVQPRVGAPPDQPVLVQDASVHGGTGSLVGFVSGEVRFIPGTLHWTEATRLAALPGTRADGVDASAWATAPKTF